MAAYAAAVSLKRVIWVGLRYTHIPWDQQTVNMFETIYKEIESFQDLLERMDSRCRKRMRASLQRTTQVILQIYESPMYAALYFQYLLDALKKARDEYNKYSSREDHDQEAAPSPSSSSSGSKWKRVGLSDVWTELKEEVVLSKVEENGLPLRLLVGMAGVGKTFLAREIFEDLDIVEWFDCRVWITVGQEWKPREIALAILAQVDPEMAMAMGGRGNEKKIAQCLKGSLKDKRFLIVLDDVWEEEVHGFMDTYLPDTGNGKVLLTSRNNVARAGFIQMRLLNEEESWHLLRRKVFGSAGMCPRRLEDAGKKIANICDGLPLTIVTVAHLLSKAEEGTESLWNEVATNKKHQLFIKAYDKISQVLHPSYEKLLDLYKPWFLYMGVFPLKYAIPASKLFNLWTVEDVVEHKINCVAYLFFLFTKSLVIILERSTTWIPSVGAQGIKTCRLHSSWWHFIQKEARKNNFFYALDCYDDAFEEGIKRQRRLSMHNNVLFALKDVFNTIEENCASTAQSLLCFGPYNQYMVPVCFGLKLLERLDALNIRFYDFPLEVLKLIKLRYLALTCNGKLPPSISKLGKLQYLIVHRHSNIKTYGAQSYLPTEIWDMKNLKHLCVMGCNLPNFGDTSLPQLTTLLDVNTDSCTSLKRVPNLKKLGIRIELSHDAVEPLSSFDHISIATKLESLKCVVVNSERTFRVPTFPRLPVLLKKLSLSGLGYPWEEMSKIASLPNLEILKLGCNAFRGPKWEVKKNEFKKVYLVQMEDLDLVNLKCARGSFKCLVVVRIKHCYKLQELDLDNNEVVRDIEAVDCNPRIERKIKENIWGNGDLILPILEMNYSWK